MFHRRFLPVSLARRFARNNPREIPGALAFGTTARSSPGSSRSFFTSVAFAAEPTSLEGPDYRQLCAVARTDACVLARRTLRLRSYS